MVNYTLYKAGQFIALHLPPKIAYRIAVVISDLRYLFASQDRSAVLDNLKAIFPGASERQLCRIRLAMFRNFAKYLVDFFRFTKIDKDYVENNITVENSHYLDEGLSRGKGVITLTAHLGNWELGGVIIAVLGYDFWVVALPHKDKEVDKFFNAQRESKGIKVIPLGKAARACLRVLENNGILALVGDRDFNRKGVVADFFGVPKYLPEGPAAFALKKGAVIVPGFMLRNKGDKFTLRFEKPIEFNPTGDREKDMLALTNKCKAVIEDYVRRYPDQWYMFRRFWLE